MKLSEKTYFQYFESPLIKKRVHNKSKPRLLEFSMMLGETEERSLSY